jgi:hypothetical protein
MTLTGAVCCDRQARCTSSVTLGYKPIWRHRRHRRDRDVVVVHDVASRREFDPDEELWAKDSTGCTPCDSNVPDAHAAIPRSPQSTGVGTTSQLLITI